MMYSIPLLKLSVDGILMLILGIALRAIFSKMSTLQDHIFLRDTKLSLMEQDIKYMKKTLDSIATVNVKDAK